MYFFSLNRKKLILLILTVSALQGNISPYILKLFNSFVILFLRSIIIFRVSYLAIKMNFQFFVCVNICTSYFHISCPYPKPNFCPPEIYHSLYDFGRGEGGDQSDFLGKNLPQKVHNLPWTYKSFTTKNSHIV